jgi:hypothetical protein
MVSPADMAVMFGEIISVGIPMAIALVAVWIMMAVFYEKVLVPRPSVSV